MTDASIFGDGCEAIVPLGDGWLGKCGRPEASTLGLTRFGVTAIIALCDAHRELVDVHLDDEAEDARTLLKAARVP